MVPLSRDPTEFNIEASAEPDGLRVKHLKVRLFHAIFTLDLADHELRIPANDVTFPRAGLGLST